LQGNSHWAPMDQVMILNKPAMEAKERGGRWEPLDVEYHGERRL